MKTLANLGRAWTLASCVLASAGAVGCEGRRPTATSAPRQEVTVGPYLAVFDLEGGVPEQAPGGLLAKKEGSFDQLLYRLRRVQQDKDAKALFVRFGDGWGLARAAEFGRALDEVRASGKPVACYADGYSNATYMAAAQGCSQIVVSPAGEVETIGLAAQILYMRKFLVDELKLSIDILQVGKFKGAEEPLTRDGPSPEARASLEGYLAGARQAWLDNVRRRRPKVVEAMEDGPYSPPRARAQGLVDIIGYADDVQEELRKTTGAVRDKRVFGRGAKDDPGDLSDLLETLAGASGGRGPIALVRATGSISMGGSSGPLGGDSGIAEKELSPVLRELEEDDAVKAVVLRIDSPGGSALASDLLWHRLMRLRKKKPLVISVGEMAASGGYYLACTGSTILVDRESLVGSIGVVGGKVGVGPLLERFGLHSEVFPAKLGDPIAAHRAAYGSPLTPWDDATRARVLESMEGVYDLFLARISEGRGLPRAKIAESAEGKVFSGEEAKRRHLVDEIGGLRDAYRRARELAKLPDDAAVHVVETKPNPLSDLLGGGEGAEGRFGACALCGVVALQALRAGPALSYVRTLEGYAPLLSGERALAVMPYGVWVK
jgi:protease-4